MTLDTFLLTTGLRKRLETRMAGFARRQLDQASLRRAAVAITVTDYRGKGGLRGLVELPDAGSAIILTRRAGGLRSHAGQWALPGGSLDPGESPEEAALRELAEEVGLLLPEERVLGVLDDFVTRSGFHITPVVIWAGSVDSLTPNDREVASIHRIPCRELCRGDAPCLTEGTSPERPILFMPVGDTFIASPTAALLYQFREVALVGRTTRVAHFEQPLFAWK